MAVYVKIFGDSKDNSNGSNFDLNFDLSTLNSKLVDKIINSCSNMQIYQSVKNQIADQIYRHLKLVKNTLKEKVQEKNKQLADVRKQLQERTTMVLSQITNFQIRIIKRLPTAQTQWAKNANYMFHENDKNRLLGAKPNSVMVGIF